MKIMYKSTRYYEIIERGSFYPDYQCWEERNTCGHAHKTFEDAEKCQLKKQKEYCEYGCHALPARFDLEEITETLSRRICTRTQFGYSHARNQVTVLKKVYMDTIDIYYNGKLQISIKCDFHDNKNLIDIICLKYHTLDDYEAYVNGQLYDLTNIEEPK
jgi:hypothetical protein